MPLFSYIYVGTAAATTERRQRKRQSGSTGSGKEALRALRSVWLPVLTVYVRRRFGTDRTPAGERRKTPERGADPPMGAKMPLASYWTSGLDNASGMYYETILVSCYVLYERAERESAQKMLGVCCSIYPLRDKKRLISMSLSFLGCALNIGGTIPHGRVSVNIPLV